MSREQERWARIIAFVDKQIAIESGKQRSGCAEPLYRAAKGGGLTMLHSIRDYVVRHFPPEVEAGVRGKRR